MRKFLFFCFLNIISANSIAAVNLIISGGVVSNSMFVSQTYTVSFTVQNTGSTSTNASFYIAVWISPSSIFSTSNATNLNTDILVSGGLLAGAKKTVSTTIKIPATYATGIKYIIAGADATSVINESSDGDNNLPFGVLIKACSLNKPTNLSPGGSSSSPASVSTTTPTLHWDAVTDATCYGVYIRDVVTNVLIYNNDAATTTNSFTVPSGILSAGGQYKWNCLAKTGCSSTSCVSSGASVVYLNTSSPCTAVTKGSKQPQSQILTAGSTATFNVSVNGTPPFSFFWYKNGNFITSTFNSSTSSDSYTTPTLSSADNGNTYYCLIQNCINGSNAYQVQSNTATLTINQGCTPPTTSTPLDKTVTAPNPATFKVDASGGTSLYNYQWQSRLPSGSWNDLNNSGNITWTTSGSSSILTISNTTGLNHYQYRCIVSNGCNPAATSNAASLTVNTTITSYTISGTITSNGGPLSGVSLTGTPGNYSASTNSLGNYSLSIPLGWSGTIVPVLSNYSFTPGSLIYSNLSINQLEQDYAATLNSAPPSIISFYNKIDNNTHFIFPKLMVTTLTNNITTPFKVCADGSQATFIEYENNDPSVTTSNIYFRIKEDINSTEASVYGSFIGTFNVSSNVRKVYFNHPTFMNLNSQIRSANIQIVDAGNGNALLATYPMHIYRAPIVFVHGFMGDKETFQTLRTDLVSDNLYPANLTYTKITNYNGSYTSNGLTYNCIGANCAVSESVIYNPLIYLVDYKQTAGKSFSINARKNVVANGIDSVFATGRANNYSCGKVVLVGHSMGGVLSRLYLQSTYHDLIARDYRFDIQKLVTVNTPHYGTQFANFMLDPLNGGLLSFFTIDGVLLLSKFDAISDLRVNSYETIHNLNIPISHQNKVPSHTISTIVTDPLSLPDHKLDGIAVKTLLCTKSRLTGLYSCKNIFNSETSDEIVPLSSQQGGFDWPVSDNNRFHVGSTRSDPVKAEVISLINSNPLNSNFSNTGFAPRTLEYEFFGLLSKNFRSTTNDSIKILNITDGQKYDAGDSINVSFSNSSGINNIKAYLAGGFNTLYEGDTSISNSSIKFKSESGEVGRRWIYILGYDSLNFRALDSVSINFNNSIPLDSIKISPRNIIVPLGYKEHLSINGYYHDGVVRELKNVTGLNFAFDSSKINVDSNYTVTSKAGPFKVFLTANYLNKEDTIIVETTSNNDDNIVNFTFSRNKICVGSQVSYTEAPVGIVQSQLWQFPGGVPNSSTLSNPIITYETAGIYKVQLITTFSNGIDTLSIDSLIEVKDNPTPFITAYNAKDSLVLISSSPTGNKWYKDDVELTTSNQIYTLITSGTYKLQSNNANICFSDTSNRITIPSFFTFTGNGSWDNPANWNTPIIPPSKLLVGSEVIINPAGDGECNLNRNLTIPLGAKLTVMAGKKLNILNNSSTITLPNINTTSVTNITSSTATTGGNITTAGGSAINSRGVCYATTSNPTTSENNISSGTGIGLFSVNLSGLMANTKYYLRAYATTNAGTTYGDEISFSTLSEPFHIGQTYAGGIIFYLDNTGQNGLVCAPADQGITTGSNTNYFVHWGCEGINISGTDTALETGYKNTAAIVAGCPENNTAAKICDDLILNGYDDWYLPTEGELSLISKNLKPLGLFVSTNACIDYWSSSQFNISNAYTTFVLGCNNNPPIYNYHRSKSANSLVRAVRAFKNASATKAIIGTNQGTVASSNSANGGGYISSDGGSPVTSRGVCWSTSPNPTVTNNVTFSGNGIGTFNSTLSGIIGCGVIYYIRAFATNSVGTSYGNEVTITSGYFPATPSTNTVTGITTEAAISGGNITNDGGCPITARGVCWSLKPNPTTVDSKSLNGTGIGSYVSNLQNLGSNLKYYVRAYATNNVGTVYGPLDSFITSEPASLYIGKTYAGGIIFYLDNTGEHGLVCAPSDQGVVTGNNTNYYVHWGCEGVNITGTSTSFGSGGQNTAALVAGCTENNTAAKICDNLILNGYSDWFLPSEDELSLMSKNLLPLGLFVSTSPCIDHWSSSQYDGTNALTTFLLSCNNNPPIYNYHRSKAANALVRAVRAF